MLRDELGLQRADRHRRARHGRRHGDLPAERGPGRGAPGRCRPAAASRRRWTRPTARCSTRSAAARSARSGSTSRSTGSCCTSSSAGIFRDAARRPGDGAARSWARRSTWPTRRRSPTAPRRWSRTTPGCCRSPPAPARCSSRAGASARPRRSRPRSTARGATTQVRESGTTPSATRIDARGRRRAGQRPRRGLDQQRLRGRCRHRAADRGRRGADPAGPGPARDREAGRGRRDAQPVRRRLVPRSADRARHLRLHDPPGRVAGAGALRRGEPERAGCRSPSRARTAPASCSRSGTACTTDDDRSRELRLVHPRAAYPVRNSGVPEARLARTGVSRASGWSRARRGRGRRTPSTSGRSHSW